MILARIYPFTRKDIKMKLDRIKEEITNIRRTQNFCVTGFIGSFSYFFINVEPDPNIRTVSSIVLAIFLFFGFFFIGVSMKEKLKELEKTGKDNE